MNQKKQVVRLWNYQKARRDPVFWFAKETLDNRYPSSCLFKEQSLRRVSIIPSMSYLGDHISHLEEVFYADVSFRKLVLEKDIFTLETPALDSELELAFVDILTSANDLRMRAMFPENFWTSGTTHFAAALQTLIIFDTLHESEILSVGHENVFYLRSSEEMAIITLRWDQLGGRYIAEAYSYTELHQWSTGTRFFVNTMT